MGQLGWAVEADGQAYCANAAVDVKLHVVEIEEAFDVLLAHGRKHQGTDPGQANLTTVGVAGEHEIDGRKTAVVHDRVSVVRLVDHEDDRGVGVAGNGAVEVRGAGSGVVGAAEPEAVAAALDGDMLIDEDRGAVGAQGVENPGGADGDVVVAEDSEALLGLEAGEDFGADAGGLPGDGVGERAAADVVAGDENQLRGKRVDAFDDVLQEPGLGVLLEVEVAHLDEAKALEGVGEVGDGEGDLVDLELVAAVDSAIQGDAGDSDRASEQELPARDEIGFRVRAGG